MKEYPKISVVTPSYNQGQFLEETILSVINQNYPNLEYIIIDGGSTDNSVDIIKKYEKYLAYWVSEKDDGQTYAIIKGLQKSTGNFLTWLNSDDTYLPGGLEAVANAIVQYPDLNVVYGDYVITDQAGKYLLQKREIKFDFDIMLYGPCFIGQPSAFFSRSIYDQVGGLDVNFNFFMDVEFWLRIAKNGGKFTHIKKTIATYRFHEESKTIKDFSVSERCKKEASDIEKKYWTRKKFSNLIMHQFYRSYLRTKNRIRRQYFKLIYRKGIDIIPGKYFVWYFKRFKLNNRTKRIL